MEQYTIWIGALISFLSVLVSIKKLFGDAIDKWASNKNEEKMLKKKVREEVVELQTNMNMVVDTLQKMQCAISEGAKHDEAYIRDSKDLAQIIDVIKDQTKTISVLQGGILGITRDKLLFLIEKHIGNEYITISEFENIESLYKSYQAMGGNSTVTELMKDIYDLPKKVKK